MSEPTIEELQRLAREVFGREIGAAEAEAYRGRLPAMARNVRTIRERERSLGVTDPAQVQRVPAGGGHG